MVTLACPSAAWNICPSWCVPIQHTAALFRSALAVSAGAQPHRCRPVQAHVADASMTPGDEQSARRPEAPWRPRRLGPLERQCLLSASCQTLAPCWPYEPTAPWPVDSRQEAGSLAPASNARSLRSRHHSGTPPPPGRRAAARRCPPPRQRVRPSPRHRRSHWRATWAWSAPARPAPSHNPPGQTLDRRRLPPARWLAQPRSVLAFRRSVGRAHGTRTGRAP
mmetsp:Transcript_49684/g.114722  ORF Transcript_49684/g.114722 Transcript_49684/m.114722 type:complete len:222 (+) Transcript_49684:378-1043(+)